MPAIATGFQIPFSWSEYDNGTASVLYTSDYSDESRYFKSEISHSTSGYQGIYFRDIYIGSFSACNSRTTASDTTTVVFNGQAVKMLRWCKKFKDADQYYLELTPATERGDSYIINLFKIATLPIKIQYDNEILYFPVIGFTKAWNSAGGNAI